MKRLYVLYDAQCGTCSALRKWLEDRPAYVPLVMVPGGTPAARQILPFDQVGELAVVSDDGRYWQGNHAWIMVLYALRGYRKWAYRLAKPGLIQMARGAFELLSSRRAALARWLNLASDAEIMARLRENSPPVCATRDTSWLR